MIRYQWAYRQLWRRRGRGVKIPKPNGFEASQYNYGFTSMSIIAESDPLREWMVADVVGVT